MQLLRWFPVSGHRSVLPLPALIIVGVIGMVLVACGANTSPEILSPEPTITPSVSPSPTFTQVPIVAVQPTSTLVPTATRPPQGPATGGPSPTSPLRPTFTPAPPTLTVTALPTNIGLEIEFFTTISEAIAPGDNVTLAWSVRGAEEVNIYRLDEEGQRERQWPVDNDGQITVSTNPSRRDAAVFTIVAESGDALAEDDLIIEVTCGQTWFFEPQPEGCPNQPAVPSLQVEQVFEGGRMIWVADNRQIFILLNDDLQPRWLQVSDDFQEGDQERDDSIIPPPGRFQPVRGFGLVWRTNTNLRERLGWAVEPEAAYEGLIQVAGQPENPTVVYMRTRDGGIVSLQTGGQSWGFVEEVTTPIVLETPEN